MKRTIFAIIAASALAAGAQDRLYFHNGAVQMGLDIASADSISLSQDGTQVIVTQLGGTQTSLVRSDISRITRSTQELSEVLITFGGENGVEVINPFAFSGVTVTTQGDYVTINSTVEEEIVYHISGTTAAGQVKVYSDFKLELLLDVANITNPTGSAINIQTGKKTTIRVPNDTSSALCDGSTYVTADGEDEKGTLFSEGQIEFRGKGSLTVTGKKKHAICSDDYVQLRNTVINIPSAASDGIHVNDYFQMESGELHILSVGGDGVDADDAGSVEILDGVVEITVDGATRKGIKSGDGSTFTISGGDITINATGGVTVESGNPSYCTAIKAKGTFDMTGGSVTILATGAAGKGISVDGNGVFSAGTVSIEVRGAGSTYTNASNATDSYASICITVDGNLQLLGGTFTLLTGSAATGGKCVKVDGTLQIGQEDADDADLVITGTTQGARFSVGSSSSGGNGGWGGGRPGGGGWGGDSGSYSNPKVIKVVGNLTVYSGTLNLKATNGEGGEGLESKATLTINGGHIEVSTVDDCINAASNITINGGYIFCSASNNDGIDSNGTLVINGGVIIALATTSPECGIDCDNDSNFTLTGSYLIGVGGNNNKATRSGTTQRCATYSVKPSTTYTFTTADGTLLMSYLCSRSYSSNMQIMFSAPAMTTSKAQYKVLTGATLTGGDTFCGLTIGGSYTGGTTASTVTSN